MRLLALLLALAPSCTTAPDHAVHRDVGSAVQRLQSDVTRMVGPAAPGRLAGPDGRPFLIDFRNALRRLPRTFRLDVPPFADYHATVTGRDSGAQWQARSTLERALRRLPL